MANSGYKSVTVTSWDTLKFSWEEASQSIANNTTKINWKLQLISTSSGRIDSSVAKKWSVTVNGTKYSGTNYIGIANNATKTLASGSTIITHNSDGSKSFSYSFSQEFAITFSGSYIGTKSGSGTGTLDTIPRKSSLTVANGTLGTAQTLKITELASAFNHKLYYSCGDSGNVYILGSASATSSTLEKSWTPPLSLAAENTTGTSVSIKFTLQTYSGSTLIGSNTYTKSFAIPTSVKPSCSVAVTDPTGIYDQYGAFVKGLSKFKVVVTPNVAYESAIASYSTTANGSKYTKASFTTGFLLSSGDLKIAATVKDKRGRSGSASVTKSVLAYTAPVISKMSVHRCNGDGTANDRGDHVKVTFSAVVTALNNLNTAKYVLRFKKSSADGYSDAVEFTDIADNYSVTDYEYIFAADTGASYSVELTVTDNHNPTTRITSASTGFTLMHWLANGLGMAIGKIAELAGVLDIGLKTRFYGGILPMVLEPETDLNDVLTPNMYIGANVSTYNYGNCPLTSGTFSLEVIGMGEDGQVKQRLTYCHKTASRVWERIYYTSAWGDWFCVSDFDGQLLWDGSTLSSGGYYMTSGHTASLTEAVSKQRSGIVLIFSGFEDGAAADKNFHSFFVPKHLVSAKSGYGSNFIMSASKFENVATKYLYIKDTEIVGNDHNNATGTSASGITYTNNAYVLRYVVGV